MFQRQGFPRLETVSSWEINVMRLNEFPPLPDEWASGHLGRVAIWAEFGSRSEAVAAIRKSVASGTDAESDPGICDALSRVAGMSLDHYLLAHTFVPFACFDRPVLQSGSQSCLSVLPKLLDSVQPLRGAAFACPACIQDDERTLGYSYWRRQHQLPGHRICHRHPFARLFALTRTNACMRPPGYWLRFVDNSGVVSLPAFQPTVELAGFHAASQAMLHSPVARCLWRAIVELVSGFVVAMFGSRAMNIELDAQTESGMREMWSRATDLESRRRTAGILKHYYPMPLLLEIQSRGVWFGESLTGPGAVCPESRRFAPISQTVPLVMGLCLTRWYGNKTWTQPSRWMEPLLAIRQLRIGDAKFHSADDAMVRLPWAGASVAAQAQLAAADFYRAIREFRFLAKPQGSRAGAPRSTSRLVRASEAILAGAGDRLRNAGSGVVEARLLVFALRLLTMQWAVRSRRSGDLPCGAPLTAALDKVERAAARMRLQCAKPSLA